MIWRGLLFAPALNEFVQCKPRQLRMDLQEAIEAQEPLFFGLVAILNQS
jgi:hypothetical protein